MSGVNLADVAHMAACLARNCGYAVFPCLETKAPATRHGVKDATSNPDRVDWLWRRFPGPLIGVATGEASGIDVLDVDLGHEAALLWARRRVSTLPQTRTYRTRSGGLHAVFRHTLGLRNSVGRPCPGIDVRTSGGFIVFWFAAGFECVDHTPPAAWPEWLLAELRPPARPPPVLRPALTPDDRAASIAGVVGVVAMAREGDKNRNHKLYWVGCRMAERIRQGSIGADEAERLLLDAARTAGLSDREALGTIRSAMRGSA